MLRWTTSIILALGPTAALAQQPYALVLEDTPAWGASVTTELGVQGIQFDVVDSVTFPGTALDQYTMIFVTSCQSDALYTAWNGRAAELDSWVTQGGFMAIHGCVFSCGVGPGAVFPQPPGGNVSWTQSFPGQGTNVVPADPLMLNVPVMPTGTSLAHTSFTATGNLNDVVLIESAGYYNYEPLLFLRTHGAGNVVVGGLTYEFGYLNNQDAGTVLINEVTWGSQVGTNCDPYDVDTDGDGVSDDCDRCEGFDDNLDADADFVPDDCDMCPGSNDFLNADGDMWPDACDNCPRDVNDAQDDTDADLVGDTCDLCPAFDDSIDADGDTIPDLCDQCVGFDDLADVDGDTVANACDICPNLYDPYQEDADTDGVGDACDLCPAFDDTIDADVDTIPDQCDICPGFNDLLDGDGDGVPSDCDNCPAQYNDLQEDDDLDGNGDVCDRCAGFDDSIDYDEDGIPDQCDVCPGFNDLNNPDDDMWPSDCDNCPDAANDDQLDSDGDGRGDACDACPGFDDRIDLDGDTRPDQCDNCVATPNQNQADADGDGPGDACDLCPFDALDDSDHDGFCDSDDRCPGFDDAEDRDADMRPDACDNCPDEPNPNQADQDEDGTGNHCDCEPENDSIGLLATEVCDGIDNNCSGAIDDVTESGSEFWVDQDGDGFGDAGSDPVLACEAPAGLVDNADDCDDTRDKIHPDRQEECGDEVDNNCDGKVDEKCKSGGCGCDSAPAPSSLGWLAGLALIAVRRRRSR